MADHKSSIISALVSQMKTGQISKNDLFEQLSTLQRPENSSAYDDNEDDSRSGVDGDDQPAINNDSSSRDSLRQESAKRTVSMEQFMASRETPRRALNSTRDRSGSTSTRQERRELEIKMENMKECTFQPQITELPKGYAASNNGCRREACVSPQNVEMEG